MDTASYVALALAGVAALLCLARVVRPGSVADRVVGLDTFVVVVISAVAIHASRTDDPTLAYVVLASTLLGFLTTMMVARFFEHRGAR